MKSTASQLCAHFTIFLTHQSSHRKKQAGQFSLLRCRLVDRILAAISTPLGSKLRGIRYCSPPASFYQDHEPKATLDRFSD